MKPYIKPLLWGANCLLLMLAACSSPSTPEPELGVSWALAQQRAARLSDIRYSLTLELPDSVSQPIPGSLTISFQLANTHEALLLDFREAPDHLQQVVVNKQEVDPAIIEGHIVLPAATLQDGANQVEITFTAGDLSLNRNPDYLYTLLVPDRASTAFPCFDQPDLKARYRLVLETPADWEAVGNGPREKVEQEGDRMRYTFRETEPFSTYLFAFAAGKFQSRTESRNGRTMTMFYRETDEAKVSRNAATVFDLHGQAIAWLEEYTQIPFPFTKLDFVLLPGFQYGGMEHIGNIFYREPSLLLEENATENQQLGRARLIAHETAHMWFGDLVTMRWFNDVWLKEVFANFMAAKIVNPSFPKINHDLAFLLSSQPTAYGEDRSEGAHPIQQPLENLRDAGSLYGGIIYQKAPVVMRQLEAIMGETAFRDGLREYLKSFSYGNATWDDLISILDKRNTADLQAWSQVWVKEAGMPVIKTERNSDGQLLITQEKTARNGRYWAQHTELALFYPDTIVKVPLDIRGQITKIRETEIHHASHQALLLNGSPMSYGYFKLDNESRTYFLTNIPQIQDPLLRGAAWMALFEDCLHQQVTPAVLLEAILMALPTEQEPLNRQQLLSYLQTLYWRFSPVTVRADLAPRVEELLWQLLEKADNGGARTAYYNAYESMAISEAGVSRLRAIWEGKEAVPGLPLSEAQHLDLACELAIRIPAEALAILDQETTNLKNPDRQRRFAFIRPALSAEGALRDSFFQTLLDPANRSTEPWVVDAVGYLHHPLRAASSLKYIEPSLAALEDIQRTGDIFFPRQWISATLGGHNSPEAAAIVLSFLKSHPDFPYRLRNKVYMAADLLFRASALEKQPPSKQELKD